MDACVFPCPDKPRAFRAECGFAAQRSLAHFSPYLGTLSPEHVVAGFSPRSLRLVCFFVRYERGLKPATTCSSDGYPFVFYCVSSPKYAGSPLFVSRRISMTALRSAAAKRLYLGLLSLPERICHIRLYTAAFASAGI